ncbi:MAG: DUF1549 domain-containing protein [Capsulimonadales bacterium]|nr:DUF1549 domain-containing protein [Capsulimonadales bacterium]
MAFRRTRGSHGVAAILAMAGTLVFNAFGIAQPPPVALPTATAEQATFFESKVRPVLVTQCVPCHGPSLQSGGVRLDNPADVRKTLVVGDPESSHLVRVMRHDGKVKMPPDGKRPASEIAVLTEWVRMGAPWPTAAPKKTAAAPSGAWWAFRPVKRVPPPRTKNLTWPTSPTDRFLLAALEAGGLTPAPPAGKRALIRRAYFDLTGLPPTPAQVESFVADRSPDAFARVVDRLLASPQYGERWARHWLDVVRYADSNGLDENKAFAYAWRYRDWVVRALNQDKPYDQFLREQLAGDLLESGNDENLRNERLTATGFLTLGAKVLAEQDKPKMVMDIVDEQIDVTARATMGLSIACARCHDHKFDPISTRDYYALAGIFKSTRTMKNLGFVSEWNERSLTTKELEEARRKHADSLKPLQAAVEKARADGNAELSAGLRRDADRYVKAGLELARQPGILLSLAEAKDRPDLPARQTIEATSFVRGNAARDTDHYGKGIGVIITNGTPVTAEWDIDVPTAGRYQFELRYAAEESRPVRLLINGKLVRENAAGGVTGSWMPEGQRWDPVGIFDFVAGKNTIRIERLDGPIPHFHRLLLVAPRRTAPPAGGDKPLTAEDIAKRDGLIPEVVRRFAARLVDFDTPDAARPTVHTDDTLYAPPTRPEERFSDAARAALKQAQETLDAARKKEPAIPIVMAVEEEMKPADVRVHLRGDTQTLGDMVPRGYPVVLTRACPPNPADPINDKSSGRLAFARWLTDSRHPLTARVAVNRTWQHLFGEGLVSTPDNWGLTGEKPSHPALLDYLASTFVNEDGWSQKKLLRRLMLSSAYRMSSVSPIAAKAARVDPSNRLLWRMNRRRLEAEPFRDSLLYVAGKLDMTMGGTLLTTPNNDYVTNDQSNDQAQYGAPRRSLYLPVIRNAIFGFFQAFDFGDATIVNARRSSTTVAPQALYLLNSPLAREAARSFAGSLTDAPQAPATDEARVRQAYYRALSRPPSPTEVRRSLTYLARFDAALTAHEADPEKRRKRVWENYCQALFATNEFCYID